VLVTLGRLIGRLLWPLKPAQRLRGRPKTSLDRLKVKMLVIRLMQRLYTAYTVLTVLVQDHPMPQRWRFFTRVVTPASGIYRLELLLCQQQKRGP
jgi:hypothetical protein